MSTYYLPRIEGVTGIATNTNPRVFYGTIMAEEMSICFVYVKISAASAGISALTPAVIKWETSYDEGTTWSDIIGVTIAPITGVGEFFANFTSNVVRVGPVTRITITPPAGQTVNVAEVRKTRVTEQAVFRAPISGGGGSGEDTIAILGASQIALAGNYTTSASTSYQMGWDGIAHKEIAVDSAGHTKTVSGTQESTVIASIAWSADRNSGAVATNGYTGIGLQFVWAALTGVLNGSIVISVSNDGVTFGNIGSAIAVTSASGSAEVTIANVFFKYFKATCLHGGITGGTIVATCMMKGG